MTKTDKAKFYIKKGIKYWFVMGKYQGNATCLSTYDDYSTAKKGLEMYNDFKLNNPNMKLSLYVGTTSLKYVVIPLKDLDDL